MDLARTTKISPETRECIQRLVSHGLKPFDLSDYPTNRLAAVLVLLYEHAGQLRVLLTTRSKALRTHAGQTALPGGRVDDSDKDLIETAFREAQEEVSLPRDCPHIQTLCLLDPHISLHKLVVTPVVAFLSNPAVLDTLVASEGEVAHIFSHPLEAFLDPTIVKDEPLVPIGSEDWIYDTQFHNTSDSVVSVLGNTMYRMHRFRSSASPIKGLTSDILIKVAEITFGKSTLYERYAATQVKGFTAIVKVIQSSADIDLLPTGYTS